MTSTTYNHVGYPPASSGEPPPPSRFASAVSCPSAPVRGIRHRMTCITSSRTLLPKAIDRNWRRTRSESIIVMTLAEN
jgi:hypothetical protein